MYFQIKEIILWPNNQDHKPQRLPFELGKVNLVTGLSKTGKSALIWIIDYCLGADNCRIPVKTIRDNTSWFGLVVQLEGQQLLLGRRSPRDQKKTGDMTYLFGKNIEIPNTPQGFEINNVSVIKSILNDVSQLTSITFDEEAGKQVGRISFRDLIPFVFQPQTIVANQHTLLFKTDKYENREKTKSIFPYLLGAVSTETLSLKHELQRLNKNLRRKDQEFKNAKRVSERWIEEMKAKVSLSHELGLIDKKNATSKEDLVALLKEAVSKDISESDLKINDNRVINASKELHHLREEERKISSKLSHLKQRLNQILSLGTASSAFDNESEVKRDRLNVAKWIKEKSSKDNSCPVCGVASSNSESIEILCTALEETEEDLRTSYQIPIAVEREEQILNNEISEVVEYLNSIKHRIREQQNISPDLKKRKYTSQFLWEFVGGLKLGLRTYETLGSDGELKEEILILRKRIQEIHVIIKSSNIENKLDWAIKRITFLSEKLLTKYLRDCERPQDPVILDLKELSIHVQGPDRNDYLWEIGSGANWVSYHIAITLALQHYFQDKPDFNNGLIRSPVPSFIVYDQPSQVYYPVDHTLENGRDEDREGTRMLFDAMSAVTKGNQGKLQVIVLDHIPASMLEGIDNIHTAADWHYGEKLIPEIWIK